jgi:hypothetical protein
MICPPGARHSPSDGCRHDLFWLTLLNRLWVADAAGSRLAGMDGPVSLSRSLVWGLQRAYYERRASEAFAEVPHRSWTTCSSPRPTRAWSSASCAPARGALDPCEPLYVVELGAGAGRFAHGFVRELGAAGRPSARAAADRLRDDRPRAGHAGGLGRQPALVDDRLDFARFDVGSDARSRCAAAGSHLSGSPSRSR